MSIVNMTPMECIGYGESKMSTVMSTLTEHDSVHSDDESDDVIGGEHPIDTVKPWSRIKASEAVKRQWHCPYAMGQGVPPSHSRRWDGRT